MLDPIYHTFMTVAECGSFSKAAGKLFVSTVAVMNQINALEGKIGAELFSRTHRGVTLTPAGKILLEETKKLKTETAKILDNVRSVAQKNRLPIRVASSMMRPATLLINLCKSSAEIGRKFSLQIIPFSDNDFGGKWLESVIGSSFDCVTSPYGIADWYKKFGILKLGEEKFKVAIPYGHRLNQCSLLKLSDLVGITLRTPPRQAPQVDKLCIALEKAGISVKPLNHVYTADTFFNHQDEIILTRDSFNVISAGFKTVDVEWDFSSPMGIIYSLSPSPQMKEFVSLLEQVTA